MRNMQDILWQDYTKKYFEIKEQEKEEREDLLSHKN